MDLVTLAYRIWCVLVCVVVLGVLLRAGQDAMALLALTGQG